MAGSQSEGSISGGVQSEEGAGAEERRGGGGEGERRRRGGGEEEGEGGGGGTVCTEEDAKGAGSAVKRRESDRVVPIRAREQRLCAMQQQKIDQRRVAVHGRVHQRGDARVVGSIDVNALL